MSVIKKLTLFVIMITTVNMNAAVINGQAFVRTEKNVFTCIGSPVYVEKIDTNSKVSILEKVSDIMWKLSMFDEDKKLAKTDEEKNKIQIEEKKLKTEENKKLFIEFEKMLKSGKIKVDTCDKDGKFFFEDLSTGDYIIETVVRPELHSNSNMYPLIKKVNVKEKHYNKVILYLED